MFIASEMKTHAYTAQTHTHIHHSSFRPVLRVERLVQVDRYWLYNLNILTHRPPLVCVHSGFATGPGRAARKRMAPDQTKQIRVPLPPFGSALFGERFIEPVSAGGRG